MNLSNSGLKNRSIKEYWLIFTILKFPLGLQFSHNLTKFKIIKYISTIYIMTTTCTYLQQLTQVSDVAHGPLVLLQTNVNLLKGLFNISGFPTFQSGVLRLYFRCTAHLLIYCQLHVTCYSYMYHVTETSFSVIYYSYYCLPES